MIKHNSFVSKRAYNGEEEKSNKMSEYNFLLFCYPQEKQYTKGISTDFFQVLSRNQTWSSSGKYTSPQYAGHSLHYGTGQREQRPFWKSNDGSIQMMDLQTIVDLQIKLIFRISKKWSKVWKLMVRWLQTFRKWQSTGVPK